jgi:hypothetical protein
MNTSNALNTHVFADPPDGPKLVHQDGRSVYYHRCLRCGRDFGQGLNGAGWQTINIGFLRIELLADSVTEQWLSEPYPRQILWLQDKQARAMRHV